ncbi:hypothetical protein H7F33_14270 [Pedobacter sp. PAMC26386]|nr:hypothetical protein H7F33_14270 [Pedobacter sp. PAMC26386]
MMNRLEMAIKNAAINGVILLPEALSIAKKFDQEEEESLKLIDQCKSWVGMDLGCDLRRHEAKLQGSYFNEKEFHYEHPVGEQ